MTNSIPESFVFKNSSIPIIFLYPPDPVFRSNFFTFLSVEMTLPAIRANVVNRTLVAERRPYLSVMPFDLRLKLSYP